MYRSGTPVGASRRASRLSSPSGSVSRGSSSSRSGITDLLGSPSFDRSPQGSESSQSSYVGLVGHCHNAGLINKLLTRVNMSIDSIGRSLRHVVVKFADIKLLDGPKLAPTDKSILFSLGCKESSNTSLYGSLFPGIVLDCYRQIIPWLSVDHKDAAEALELLLPEYGPMVAVDLGYILAAIVAQFDIKNAIMPNLIETEVNGVKFLHVDIANMLSMREFVLTLLSSDAYVGGGGSMDPMDVIRTATHAGAQSIGANQASTIFRDSLQSMVEVKTRLTTREEEWIKYDRVGVLFTRCQDISNDHPYQAACREIIRSDFDKCINLKKTTDSTLILGAAMREYNMYNRNSHVSFQFAARDSKDTERILADLSTTVLKAKRKKIGKHSTDEAATSNSSDMITASSLVQQFKETRQIPDRIVLWDDTVQMMDGTKELKFKTLIFQDVGYDFTIVDWGNIFRVTGAMIAYGYMSLPWELMFPDIAPHPFYAYRLNGTFSDMGFHGYCNGYTHKTTSWRTLMTRPKLVYTDFALCVEFVSRVGAMTLIKIQKTTAKDVVVRLLELPDYLKSVQVLDVAASIDPSTGLLRLDDLKYISVRYSEFHEGLNYALDIAKDSVTRMNIMLFVRRRVLGVSLVKKEYSSAWTVPQQHIPSLSMVLYLYAIYLSEVFDKVSTQVKGSHFRPILAMIMSKLRPMRDAGRLLKYLFTKQDYFQLLVLGVDHSEWQRVDCSTFFNWGERDWEITAKGGPKDGHDDEFNVVEIEDEMDKYSCNFCLDLKDVCGSQIFTCDRGKEEEFFHNFSLSGVELAEFRTKLNDTEGDPVGLKNLKEKAAQSVPDAPFDHKIRVKYICGPPGTGKSHIIRAMATSEDLVVGPFARLKEDYQNFDHPLTGRKSKLTYMTQHTAMSALNVKRVFVDEYTAYPYESLAIVAYKGGANEVILVGDHQQTRLIHGIEGISIPTKIDLTKMRSHKLVKNFRNPCDVVNVLNVNYNYKMLATNQLYGYKFDTADKYSDYPDHTPLFFKKATAASFGVATGTSDKVTVRANQGATYEKVKLVVTPDDTNLLDMDSMAIVALSRHRKECVILTREGRTTIAFKAKVQPFIKREFKQVPDDISPVFSKEEIQNATGLIPGTHTSRRPVQDDANDVDDDEEVFETSSEKTLSDFKDSDDNGDGNDDDDSDGSMPSLFDTNDPPGDDDDDPNDGDQGGSHSKKKKRKKKKKGKKSDDDRKRDDDKGGDDKGDDDRGHSDGSSPNESEYETGADDDNVKTETTGSGGNKEPKSEDQPKTPKMRKSQKKDKGDHQTQTGSSGNVSTSSRVDVFSVTPLGKPDAGILGSPNIPLISPVMSQMTPPSTVSFDKYSQRENPMFDTPVDHTDKPSNMKSLGPVKVVMASLSDTTSGSSGSKESKGYDERRKRSGEISQRLQKHVESLSKQTTLSNKLKMELDAIEENASDEEGGSVGVSFMETTLELPSDNMCLLECLSHMTGNDLNTIWKGFVYALGVSVARTKYGQPFSTDDLAEFCYVNNLRVEVLSGDKVIDCGLFKSQYLGSLIHEQTDEGHFRLPDVYLTNDCKIKTSSVVDVSKPQDKFNLNLNDVVRGDVPKIWDELIKGVIRRYNKLSRTNRSKTMLTINRVLSSNPEMVVCLSRVSPTKRTIDQLSVSEMVKLLHEFPFTKTILEGLLFVFLVRRGKDLWVILIDKLIKCEPAAPILYGATSFKTVGIFDLVAPVIKEAPPNAFTCVDKGFQDMARLFADRFDFKTWLVDMDVDDQHEIVPLGQSSYDSFKMLVEEFSMTDESAFVLTNQESLGYIGEDFGNGYFDMTTYDNLNARKHPKRRQEKAWCLLNVAPGVSYFRNNLEQSLHCLQARYLTKAYATIFNWESLSKAREIAELFFNEHMRENFDVFNEQDMDVIIQESEHAMVIKNYHKQTSFEPDSDLSVRFNMKEIFKPFKTKVDIFKAGQGISAWSKDMQTIFQSAFRIINRHFINSLQPHVVFDNGIDEFTLMAHINGLFGALPSVALNGVIDATACDSGQNLFTQAIERRILELLNIDDDFLDWYYSERESYVLKGYGVVAKIREIKTSGEPATLLNNTILMACLMNYMIRGEGPCVLVIKGDDGLKRQPNLAYRQDKIDSLRSFLKMEFKVDIDVPITFCGYFLAGPQLLPDLIRKVFKILGHRFKNYEHFCEYQKSLRDWVLVVNKLGLTTVCAVNAENYDLTMEMCYQMFESIVSLTHINERQFKSFFEYRTINLDEEFLVSEPWSQRLPWYKGDN